jgi:pyruvate kinase
MKVKSVKIVATVGPATNNEEKIFQLVEAGVDVFRINLSHATAEKTAEYIKWIRNAEEKFQKPLTVMGDLPGPKIRISDIKPFTVLQKGQKFVISKNVTVGDANSCGLNHPSIVEHLQEGAEVFIDDGAIKLIIDKKSPDTIETTVLVGGPLKPKKGFSAEGISLHTTGVSDSDKANIKMLTQQHADAVAVSFVQNAQDIIDVRNLLPKGSKMFLIAKIETAAGVENAVEIVEAADAVMVARGDLGLAVPIAQVPAIQKSLIHLCVQRAKPVITATQMLESMTHNSIPTRAEVTDVANAILDRTDAVMLSAETADGMFPVEAVEMMVKIIEETGKRIEPYEYPEENTTSNAISDSVGKIARQVHAKIIVAFTQNGVTARRISRHRPQQAILAISPDPEVIRSLNFSYGVYPHLVKPTKNFADMLAQAKKISLHNNYFFLEKTDKYVICAGMPYGESGNTNLILVQEA